MAARRSKKKLSSLDALSIVCYRLGLILMSLSLLGLALQQLYYPLWYKHVVVWLSFSVCLLAANLHINNKKKRYILITNAWFGVWLLSLSFISTGVIFTHLSLACLLIFCFAISEKESDFFPSFLLQLNSLSLVAFYISVVCSINLCAAIFAILSGLLTAYLAYKKMSFALSHDLVNRKKYQV